MQVAPKSSTTAGQEHRAPLRRRIRHVLLGDGPIIPLAVSHGLSGSADAFVTVSLAGSLFFNISPDASRQQVLLYLLVTMAPLAVLAPLVGPAVDRFRRSQRFVASIFYLLRAVSCLAMVSFLLDLTFYPLALILLIASKASGVVKQTLVQQLVDDPDELVATNARLARLASITAAIGAGVAAALLTVSGPGWTLRIGAVLFALASFVVLQVRTPEHVIVATDDVEYAETHLPVVFVASVGMVAIRGAVGFFLFTLAFTLRRDSQPAVIYGLAAACYGFGAFAGHTVISLLRRRFSEQQLIGLAIAAPAAFTAVGILGVSTPLLLVIAALVGLSTTLGRNAFDSLLQRRAPEALLGRAGARYETRFQLAWVFGGAVATPISLAPEVSMMILTAIYLPGLAVFIRALREAGQFEGASVDALAGARQRVLMARHAWEAEEYRTAIIDASAAADLAQTVHGPFLDDDRDRRILLDELRRAAIDPKRPVLPGDAIRALEAAGGLLDGKLQAEPS
ncbi:MAG: MFS transporter [Ilumatobacter sp.]|uniref:MFS transporter n=1 Tax=Ilumatobacter sp. TaxID=1967498 RepID=UPI003753BA36|nr:MFS transporter [Ilumatobacter sp.]